MEHTPTSDAPRYREYAVEYAATLDELRLHSPDLADEFRDFDSVIQVVDWLHARGFGKTNLDFISHDEFSYDLLIHFDASRWLAFGVN